MKVTIVPIVIGALGTITKGLLKGLEDLEVGGRVETIQATALQRTARILRRVLETWGDLLSANTDVKNSQCEKKDKYLDLAREVNKLWNMQVTIIPIVIGAFGTVTKGLLKGREDLEVGRRVETIQTTAFWELTEY